MAREVSSISRVGTSEPFELQISRGQIAYHERVHKFGFNPLINDTEETIWDVGGTYVYPSSALAMTVTSVSGVTDSGVVVTVQGLDGSYAEVSETVTLNASGTATTTQTFLRVFRAFISGSDAPSGTINITNSSTTYARITAGDNQTLMTVWTVPAGYTAYLFQKDTTCLTEANNKFGTIRLIAREPGGVFRTKDKYAVQNGHTEIAYTTPLPFPEKTDLEVRAVASSSNALLHVSVALDIVYIRNGSDL
jgi:hypothetical protein